MPQLNLYSVVYQVRKAMPTPNARDGVVSGNLYTKDATHAMVLAADGGPAVLAVLKSNLTLASGEVIDLLKSQQAHGAGTGVVLA